ncbi:hypothetical protein NP493_2708g00001 [Ridgeia piscesae]|uniref:Uncharacterized protein n=1 Tax=Ridgeia piscesae TaxID=27915 RepID=A0AAD9MYW1_RIDPI|nr:hypothetical protein NP493_2708g00001 [Ridgeia piscesae]
MALGNLEKFKIKIVGVWSHPPSLTTLMTHMTGACLQLEVFHLWNNSPCLDTETAAQSLCDCLRQWTRLRQLHLDCAHVTDIDVVSNPGADRCGLSPSTVERLERSLGGGLVTR